MILFNFFYIYIKRKGNINYIYIFVKIYEERRNRRNSLRQNVEIYQRKCGSQNNSWETEWIPFAIEPGNGKT